MRRVLTRAALVGALALSGMMGMAATATALPTPAAQVTLDGTGVIGRFDSAVISGSLQCRAGSVQQELVVTVTQGADSGTSVLNNFTCDGTWHRFTTESLTDPLGGPFEPGNTWVDARLTVYEPVNYDPLPQGHDANAVWLRPNVKVTAVWPMVLGSDGNVTVTVDAVCRGPWAADSIGVNLYQGLNGLDAYGETYVGYPPVPCDGKLHRLKVVVEPLGDTVFRIRPTILALSMSIWDEAWTGDPINGYTWQGQVRIVRG